MPRAFLMAGGGTGGHVIPALAVARELRQRGHQRLLRRDRKGIEARLVPAEGFELKRIDIGGLNRVGMRQKIATLVPPARLPRACGRLVRGVSAVFSMGGYVAGPPVMAALLAARAGGGDGAQRRSRIHQPRHRPLRVRARWSRFRRPRATFPRGQTEITGLPVREEFFAIPPRPRGGALTVLITGGSQGSRTLNRAARESWPLFLQAGLPVRMVHQTGPADCEELRAPSRESGLEGEVVPFIADMPAAFAAADLVVCRSGAGAVSELAAAGKPSILVPFPFAADDHQTRNAEAMRARRRGAPGAGRGDERRKLFVRAGDAVLSWRARNAWRGMGEAARQFAKPGAARRAAEILGGRPADAISIDRRPRKPKQ